MIYFLNIKDVEKKLFNIEPNRKMLYLLNKDNTSEKKIENVDLLFILFDGNNLHVCMVSYSKCYHRLINVKILPVGCGSRKNYRKFPRPTKLD